MSAKLNPIPAMYSNDDINFKLSFEAMETATIINDMLQRQQLNTIEDCEASIRFNPNTMSQKASLHEIANRAYLRFMRREGIRPILH